MKLIHSYFALAAVRVNADAVAPPKGAVIKDVVDGVGRRYEFVNKPPVQMAAQGQPIVFHGGAFKTTEHRIPIMQLALVSNGDIVMSQTTEMADSVLSDLIYFFEETFSYRYKSADQKRLYHSNLVVQFDKDMDAFDLFARIESLLNEGREIEPPRFQFKRIGFGQGESLLQQVLSIESMETADFTIERRAGEPYSSNRFFCGAPLRTEEHLTLLEKIEKLF